MMDEALYPQVYSWYNLLLAADGAARGKRGQEAVARFEYHLEDNLVALQEELRDKTYRPGAYTSLLHPRAQAAPDLAPRPFATGWCTTRCAT